MQKIIFYDGNCGFCNKFVQFVLKNERGSQLFFASLQSNFAKNFFNQKNILVLDLSTFYFWEGNQLLQKSSGVLSVVSYLKWSWQIFKIAYVLPKSFRDKIYDFIAKNRYKISRTFCVLPTMKQRERFLA